MCVTRVTFSPESFALTVIPGLSAAVSRWHTLPARKADLTPIPVPRLLHLSPSLPTAIPRGSRGWGLGVGSRGGGRGGGRCGARSSRGVCPWGVGVWARGVGVWPRGGGDRGSRWAVSVGGRGRCGGGWGG